MPGEESPGPPSFTREDYFCASLMAGRLVEATVVLPGGNEDRFTLELDSERAHTLLCLLL